MSITEVAARFKTTDGQEWERKEDAERHQAFVDAEEELAKARRRYQRALAGSQKTADGVAFEPGLMKDYYAIHFTLSGPRLERISFGGWNFRCEHRSDANGVYVVVMDTDIQGRARDFPIRTLYAHERNAKLELLKQLELALAEDAERIAKLRVSLFGPPK
jgi:hypothetical protein